jgi:hypothetical protein
MKLTTILLATALFASVNLPATAQTPPFADIKVHKQSSINYVSGGVTAEERKELARIANKYPMQLLFTLEGHPEGATGVKVTVKDLKGDKLIEAVAEGPYFFLNPPSSRWTMDAEYEGETISRTVDLIGRRYIVLEFHFGGEKKPN